MITKERLRQYCMLGMELKSIEQRLAQLESELYSVRSIVCTAGRGKKNRREAGADFSGLLVKMIDLKTVYERKWDRLIDERADIEKGLEALPYEYRAIIRAKYIDGKTWEETADEVGYSVRQVYRLMKAAGI